jgi:predicted DNA-binding transcriptional regulator YafY
MNRTERFYKIDQMLHEHRVVPIRLFLESLGVSRATFNRDLEYLRDRLHAPVVWDRVDRGYRFDGAAVAGPAYALPGLWFSSAELHALLTAWQLLAGIEPGVLANAIAPVRARLLALLEEGGHPADEISRRVALIPAQRRRVESRFFAEIASALLERRRLCIEAWNRERAEVNVRYVSPQRLVHYRENWYLEAWCHWRDALRSFSLDSLRKVTPLQARAQEIPQAHLEARFAAAYGIFGGEPKEWAVLRFGPERARWVRDEQWHPRQEGEDLADGGYRIRIPYADERELLMDILRHGHHVVVEGPPALRQRVREEAERMLAACADEESRPSPPR